MSDSNRSGFGHDDARGPIDRTADALDGRDDPNRSPLDRAANAVTGGTGGVSRAMHHDDPTRGPIDRTANALDGHDDPNRGIFDRTANAMAGGTGGVAAALDGDAAATGTMAAGAGAGGEVVSAVFDSEAEAQAAVSDLRAAGVRDDALSLIAQSRNTTTTRDGVGTVVDEEHGSFLRGILGGGALGAGLGVAALAIPGVGPLIGLGAIAASAVPGAMAAGAAFGAAAGTWNEKLAHHGISHEDASYYGERVQAGGILLTVQTAGADAAQARDILFRNGGHTAARARTAAL